MSQGKHCCILGCLRFHYSCTSEYDPVQDTYDDPNYGMDEDEDNYEEITQEDCWTVISSFFDQKGLVRQQLDSFDEFVQNTMQELVDENSDLILDQADQHTGHDADMTRRYEIKFGQIYLSRPNVTEADGSVVPVFPQEARMRNLTYSAPLYIEMKKRVLVGRDSADGTGDIAWEAERDDNQDDSTKVWIGKVSNLLFQNVLLPKLHVGTYHAPIHVLHSSWIARSRPVRFERVPLRFGGVFYHQWLRKGVDCSRTNGNKSCLRLCQSSTVAHQLPCRDTQCGGERRKDYQPVSSQDVP
jgi:RNA polymerase beta subunit